MPATSTAHTRLTQSDSFLQALAGYRRFLVITHDNPDPDAIATGWAIHLLIQERLGGNVRLIGGGEIVRAENRHMVDLLEPPIELVRKIEVTTDTATILVDCAAGTTNHLLTREDKVPVVVIDHHQNGRCPYEIPFSDVRPDVAASASIATSYLREQRVEPGAMLATALLYAMRTETQSHEAHFSRIDRSNLLWLTERAEPALLAEIENAPLSRGYFGDLVLAIQSTFIYDDAGLCLLPRAHGPEIVGEVADLLIRCEGVNRVLCGAIVGEDVLFSARTGEGAGSATDLLRLTLQGIGHAGGHQHRAGGKIANLASAPKFADQLHNDLRNRWLAACNVDRRRGTRLIARREIVENL
ncbi:MAG: DHH family phosphoesterase [Pirellulales bacterium]